MRFLGALRTVAGVGLLWYVLAILGPETLSRLRSTTWWLLPAMAVLPFVGGAVEAVRLRLLFGAQGMDLSRWRLFKVALIAAFFNACVPGATMGGDAMRIYALSGGQRGKLAEIVAVLLVDRLVSLVGLLTVILALAWPALGEVASHDWLRWLVGASAVLWLVLVVGIALACSPLIHEHPWRVRAFARIPFGEKVGRFADALYVFHSRRRVLIMVWLASLPGHLALALMFLLAGSVFLPECSPLLATATSLLAVLANVLPVTPGGIGVGELAFDRLFETLGHDGGASLQLAWRVAMIVPIVAGGVLYSLGKWKA